MFCVIIRPLLCISNNCSFLGSFLFACQPVQCLPSLPSCFFANNNNNNRDNIYSAVIIAEPLWEFAQFTRWIQKRRQMAADLWTKPTSLSQYPNLLYTLHVNCVFSGLRQLRVSALITHVVDVIVFVCWFSQIVLCNMLICCRKLLVAVRVAASIYEFIPLQWKHHLINWLASASTVASTCSNKQWSL